ncbi:hypothetical protein ACHWQZ_G007898 [Mnemiopsis leidyi]
MKHKGEFGNRTAYEIKSDVSKYTWEGFLIFVAVSSLIGDTTILIASLKYRSIKLHRTIVVIIQHIAFCDLMVVMTDVLPKIISIATEEWVLGNFMCRATTYARYFFILASLLLICTMTTSKMFLIKYPLRFGRIAMKTTHCLCVASWMGALAFPSVLLLSDKQAIYFSYRGYQCNFADFDASPTFYWLKPTLAVLLIFIPACLVVATTVYILVEAKKVARRSRGNLKWQGTMTTVATASFYFISVLPLVTYRVLESFSKVEDKSESFLFKHFYRVAISFPFINTISNFYIYCLTVASFREFVLSRAHRCCRFVRRVHSFNDNGTGEMTKTKSTRSNKGTKGTNELAVL